MKRKVLVRAPSNIALIKYMGKTDATQNLPENGSLSMTLNGLCTYVELEEGAETNRFTDEAPSVNEELIRPKLDEKSRAKLQTHCERVASRGSNLLSIHGLSTRKVLPFYARSANTFPAASGIASSASSYAALTLAIATLCAEDPNAFRKLYRENRELRRGLANLSREGSGSSCRSFEGPWVKWEVDSAQLVYTPEMPKMAHFVALISSSEKSVSSSQAHLRVKTSPLWTGRPTRANQRLGALTGALASGDLKAIALLTWSEAWEMHSLFHTAAEPFSYWKGGSIDGLHYLSQFLVEDQPPIVTLDAGPNIHIIVPESKREQWRAILRKQFSSILEDGEGQGAEIL